MFTAHLNLLPSSRRVKLNLNSLILPHSIMSKANFTFKLRMKITSGEFCNRKHLFHVHFDLLCALVVRVPGYRSRDPDSDLYRPSDRRLSTKIVPIFANRGCHVVSVTDPYGRILAFSRPEPLLFLPSRSSIVLVRLSEPSSKPTENLVAPGIESGPLGL
jgi:hypothetical protein